MGSVSWLLLALTAMATASVQNPYLDGCRQQLREASATVGVTPLVEERASDPVALVLATRLNNCRKELANYQDIIRLKLELKEERGGILNFSFILLLSANERERKRIRFILLLKFTKVI